MILQIAAYWLPDYLGYLESLINQSNKDWLKAINATKQSGFRADDDIYQIADI